MTLTKAVKDLYNDHHKTLKKETEKETRRWKDFLCSQNDRFTIVKTTLHPHLQRFTESMQSPSKYQ